MPKRRRAGSYARLLVVVLVAMTAMGGAPSTAAGAPDTKRPSITLTTADGDVLVGPTALTGQAITGTVRDDGRVESISIDYCGGATPCGALLSDGGFAGIWEHALCRGGRTCTWELAIPSDAVGVYQIRATAIDAAGNRRTTKPIQVTILAPCPPCWV